MDRNASICVGRAPVPRIGRGLRGHVIRYTIDGPGFALRVFEWVKMNGCDLG